MWIELHCPGRRWRSRAGARKSLLAAIAWWSLGWLGAHRFYLGDWGWGMIYLFTGGLFTIGWFVDAFLLPGKVDAYNRRDLARASRRLASAWVVRPAEGVRGPAAIASEPRYGGPDRVSLAAARLRRLRDSCHAIPSPASTSSSTGA